MSSLRLKIRDAWLVRLQRDPQIRPELAEALRRALPDNARLDRESLRAAVEQAWKDKP